MASRHQTNTGTKYECSALCIDIGLNTPSECAAFLGGTAAAGRRLPSLARNFQKRKSSLLQNCQYDAHKSLACAQPFRQMPKRKRESDEENHRDGDRAQKIRKSRFQAKIEQGNKSIASALKLARGFERQKLGRRQKTAKNDPKELLRLKDEVLALKALDLGKTAEKYLFKQLAKTKRIKESPAFVAMYGTDPVLEAAKPGPEANVVGRLFNSNPIKEVMPGVMKGILGCLGLDIVVGSAGGMSNVSRQPPAKRKAIVKSKLSEEDEFSGFSAEEDETDLTPPNLKNRPNHVDESEDDELAEYEDRLASDASTDSESVSSTSFQAPSKALNGTDRHPLIADDISLSPSPALEAVPTSSAKAAKATAKPSGTTTFLPSLMMGGYYSGSDSDDGGDAYLQSGKDPLQNKQRKNRRGQRARQEIAEKKYGKNANHLKKLAAREAQSRDAGWDARKGATEGRDRGRGFGNRMGGRGISRKLTGANGAAVVGRRDFGAGKDKVEVKAKEKEKEGPLHPSWEAAKKRKEQRLGTTAAFVGKKVIFD
jgi:hypothetical protein